jgi:filamentous hemagglutinin family protein
MNSAYCRFCLTLALVVASGPVATPGWSQISPDATVNSLVTPNGNTLQIEGGTVAGTNLFHSFQEFSVPTGTAAFFNNPLSIENIITRVTGSKISNIDGLIRANGTANLFLLNPNGIFFGPNAQLNIGGSFLGTTASSIKFADGVEFSAIPTNSPPLLTVSVPIGLNLGQNSGTITVRGQGNQLFDSSGLGVSRVSTRNTPPGLQVGANQTLALIGGIINFSGGVVSTNGGGHLEVGSVSNGQVRLNDTSTGWVGDYSAVSQFNDIHLAQQSILNAGDSNSSIQIQGQNISLTEGSAALIHNFGTQASGGITVNARGSLNLTGNTANGQVGSLIRIANFGTEQTGGIAISAAQLSLQDGARIITIGTQTPGGSITTNVSGTTEISGVNPNNPALYSAITTYSFGNSNAGNITVSTGNLRILDSGEITSVALRAGDSGTIQVNATEQVEIAGYHPLTFYESTLSTFTQGSGKANNTVINTSRLVIQGGASLGATTVASGSAGSVEVNASESINIEGRATQGNGAGTLSRIFSNAEMLSPEAQAIYGLPAIPTGNAGSLTINTPLLRLADGGAVSVKNDGPGLAGNVQVNGNSIFLDNQSSITATTASGNGGDVRLNLQDNLLLRHNSLISATAAGLGNGGNLSVSAPVIVGLENSDIAANAVQGAGGNIQISTQGIFGLEFRPQSTPESDITASSQFGVSGTVRISTPDVQPEAVLVELPANLIDPNQKIAQGCDAAQNNRFIATGRGGLPPNPTQRLETEERPWTDVRDLSAFRQSGTTTSAPQASQPLVIEANTWKFNQQGQVEIYVSESVTPNFLQPTCADS